MLSGVTTICFAASYAVALVLEASRLLFRSSMRGFLMLGFAIAGLVAHSAFLYYRAVNTSGVPLSSNKDWFLAAAWFLVVVYIYLTLTHTRIPFGLFLLPLVLGLIGAATFFASDVPLARESASRIWGTVHGLSIMFAAVAVLTGFTAGVMYFVQAQRLKQKRSYLSRLRLPSLEWLQATNSRAIVISVFMLGLGVVSGLILNMANAARQISTVPWNDPVILSTLAMFCWLLAASIFSALHGSSRAGRKVAALTIASFVFLVVVLAVGFLIQNRHWERNIDFSDFHHKKVSFLLPSQHDFVPERCDTQRQPGFNSRRLCGECWQPSFCEKNAWHNRSACFATLVGCVLSDNSANFCFPGGRLC